ncbi:DUF6644 family protein [Sphingobium tyrosinilyticum]|uniref:DUF6644 family protein n=1 Tax=Sphingobium tyrosinilyticum TaxID=2715436 RepID=A0ABV9F103_9SPHN
MTVNLRDLAPSIQPAVDAIAAIPVIRYVNETAWIFAVVETGHLLFLAILGGSVLGLNLRLLGLILPGMSNRDVERALHPWYVTGVVGTIVTGVAMAITVARTLLPSGAFFIKMVALAAAILLSHVVARQVRSGRMALPENAIFGLALLLWSGSLLLFATTQGLNSGAMLIGLAGAGILAAASQPRHRPAIIGLFVVAFGAWFFALDGISDEGHLAGWAGNALLAATVVPALGAGVRDIRAGSHQADVSMKVTAFASTLAWVTVAAAGRWIGFS